MATILNRVFPKSFGHLEHRGISLPNYDSLSQDKSIKTVDPPDTVLIPLNQHQGPAPTPCVGEGQQVAVGELIARAKDSRGVNLHASITGEITSIKPWPSGNSPTEVAIEIKRQSTQLMSKRAIPLAQALTYCLQNI